MSLEVGNIYKEGRKVVLVFGLAERDTFLGQALDGIGVNLNTGDVDVVGEYADKVYYFSELNEVQLLNFSTYYPVLVKILKSPILSISGKARSGKDTLATRVSGTLHYNITALGDPIKKIHKIVYGNSDKKDREGLIIIGQGMREKDPHIWIKIWLRSVIKMLLNGDERGLIITDVRQPNEFSFFKSVGALTVRIDSNEEKRKEIIAKIDGEEALKDELLNDETESHVATFKTDLLIYNEYDSSFNDEIMRVVDELLSVERAKR